MTPDLATPAWFSVLPPLVAIAIALTLRSVIPALFIGTWVGAWGIAGLDLTGLWRGLLDSFQVYVLGALSDADHAAVILFSFMIGGLVGVVTTSGGMQAIVDRLARRAHTRRRGQLITAAMGLIVFIDDYANSLVVGKTMQPVTDRLRISREKLAYLVDSTAAPVSALALISTWIGYQVGLIGDATAGIEGIDSPPYLLLLQSLVYSFYPWMALFLVFWSAHSGRNLGPMIVAEHRAALAPSAPAASTEPKNSGRVSHAVIPIVVLVGGVVLGLLATGEGDSLRDIIGSADSYRALMWASLSAVLVAIGLPLLRRETPLPRLMEGWIEGVQSMLLAMIVLVLAWALAETTSKLGTASFLASLLGDSFPGGWLPTLVFLISAATAFATGTSWGTMGILMPLVIPLAYKLDADPETLRLLPPSIAAILAGAVWGDHCSPISDTTVLSSMASGCDHVEHVRTQLPYALLAGGVALLVGVLPSGFGFPWWLSLPIGAAVLILAMRVLGQKAEP